MLYSSLFALRSIYDPGNAYLHYSLSKPLSSFALKIYKNIVSSPPWAGIHHNTITDLRKFLKAKLDLFQDRTQTQPTRAFSGLIEPPVETQGDRFRPVFLPTALRVHLIRPLRLQPRCDDNQGMLIFHPG